jgi:hypothetical protein
MMADKMGKGGHVEYGREEKQIDTSSPASSAIESTTKGELRTVDAGLDVNDVLNEHTVDPVEARRIMRKIDFRVIPLLSLLYL